MLLFLSLGYLLLVFAAYFFQENMLFHPQRLTKDITFEFSYPFEEHHIQVNNEASINVLFFPSKESKGLILYFHGNAGNLQSWGHVAEDFLPFQYDLLIMDYRGYGKSTGPLSEAVLYSDAQKVYDFALTKCPRDRIVVYGRSLGSGVAVALAATNDVSQLILEAPYFSMLDLANKWAPWLPNAWLLKYPLRSDLYYPQINCPVMIFHGDQDKTIYTGSSLKLSRLFKPEDQMVIIAGGGHNNLASFSEYKQRLKEVLR